MATELGDQLVELGDVTLVVTAERAEIVAQDRIFDAFERAVVEDDRVGGKLEEVVELGEMLRVHVHAGQGLHQRCQLAPARTPSRQPAVKLAR